MEGADSLRNGRRDGMVTNSGDGHTVQSQSSPPGWIESTVKSAFTWRKRFQAMAALMCPLWTMQTTHSFSVPGGAWQERLSVEKWAHNSPLTRWSLLCYNSTQNFSSKHADKTAPLLNLVKKGVLSKWDEDMQVSSNRVKQLLSKTITVLPGSKEIILF